MQTMCKQVIYDIYYAYNLQEQKREELAKVFIF